MTNLEKQALELVHDAINKKKLEALLDEIYKMAYKAGYSSGIEDTRSRYRYRNHDMGQ